MKINNYSLVITSPESGDLYATRNGQKILVDQIDIKDKNSAQIDELVKYTLEKHDMEVVDVTETVTDTIAKRKNDLSAVRSSMRKILKTFGDKNISLEDKKELIDVYEIMCKASDVMIKTCVVELTYDKAIGFVDDDKI